MNREGRLRGILHQLVGHIDAALLSNPYLIVYRTGLEGLGDPLQFDALVLAELGLDALDPRRLEFLAWLVLDGASADGHTAVPLAWAVRSLAKTSGASPELATETLRNAVRLGALTATKVDGAVHLQLAPLDRAERTIAQFARSRLGSKKDD